MRDHTETDTCRQQRCCRLRPERLSAPRSVAAYRALRHPCCPICPRHPLPAQGGEGAGNDAQPSCRSIDDPNCTVGGREAPRGHWAERLATILGTTEGQGPLEAAI